MLKGFSVLLWGGPFKAFTILALLQRQSRDITSARDNDQDHCWSELTNQYFKLFLNFPHDPT